MSGICTEPFKLFPSCNHQILNPQGSSDYGVCIAGAWLCLNSMGHHVWKVIRSKSVFTRVTDGQRCCYYSLYVILGTGLVSGTATAAHFLVGRQEGYGEFKVMTSTLSD